MPWKDSSVVKQRRELVQAMLAGVEPVVAICHRFGVSRQTAYKFLARFRADGGVGLQDHSHVPAQAHARQAPRWCERILRLRKTHPTWGARKLRWLLRRRFGRRRLPAERTVQRWIEQAGLARQRRPQRRRVQSIRRGTATIARRSNAVWTIDLKGWFRTHSGVKIEPLTIRDLWSRFVLWTQPLAPKDEPSVRRICQRSVAMGGHASCGVTAGHLFLVTGLMGLLVSACGGGGWASALSLCGGARSITTPMSRCTG